MYVLVVVIMGSISGEHSGRRRQMFVQGVLEGSSNIPNHFYQAGAGDAKSITSRIVVVALEGLCAAVCGAPIKLACVDTCLW
jgi:hypothetical protein